MNLNKGSHADLGKRPDGGNDSPDEPGGEQRVRVGC